MQGDPFWDLRGIFRLFWRWRRFLVWNVGVVTVAALVLSLLLPHWYRATTTLLPPREDESSFSVSTMLRGLSIPGVRIPTQASPGEVFVAILNSRSIHTRIVEEFDLKKIYRKKKLEDTIKEFRRHFYAGITEDGLIELQVEDRKRDRAAAMANRMVELLDRFNRETRSSRGKRARIFVEARLRETKSELAVAEDSLRQYQQRNKALLLPPEEAGAADIAARLLAERIDLQMRLGMASSYAAESNPEVQRLRLRQGELDRQIQRLPALGLGVARLYRDVKVQEQVFSLLMAQLEEAKIEEAKDVTTIEVLDPAIPPERKARPRRLVIVLLGFAGSLVLGVGYVLVSDYVQRSRAAG